MSRKGNTDAMCAKFTRFDRMYSHLASVDEEGDTQETPSGNIRYTGVKTDTSGGYRRSKLVACAHDAQ